MSDYIPFEIQAHILKMLPVKSLVLFRSVSKQWKSLIDSSKFISNHNAPHPDPQHLLVSYIRYDQDYEELRRTYVSFKDDNTFPKHKFSPTVPVSVNQLKNPTVNGYSKGLFCLCSNLGKPIAVLWNPSIGKSVVINVPNVFYGPYKTVIAFAVCPRTNDPKLLKATFIQDSSHLDSFNAWHVELFSLNSNVWRTLSINLPDKSIALTAQQEVIDGVIYWLSIDRVIVDNARRANFLIMSFDITTEEFTKIDLPDRLFQDSLNLDINLSISKLRDSLVIIEGVFHHRENGFDVWIMENGVPESFTKLFNINPPHGSIEKVFGFLKTSAPIIGLLMFPDDSDDAEPLYVSLSVYVPYSKHIDNIGISGNLDSFSVYSYTESLLLLDH